jgi:hypothetical protein
MTLDTRWTKDQPLFEVVFLDADFEKHLSGKHDQSTHGKGGAKDFSGNLKEFYRFTSEPSFSDSQEDAIKAYQGGLSAGINSYLAGKTQGNNTEIMAANKLRAAIDKTEGLPEAVTLYSGVRTNLSGDDMLDGLSAGMVISKKGFLSTSADKNFATKWISDGWKPDKGYVIKITAPKGTKGIMPYRTTFAAGFKNEYEFLMRDSQPLLITNVDEASRTIEAEVVID